MLLLVALRNILRNPRRSLATVVTVAMGACALWLFDGFNAGLMNQYRDNAIHARFGHGQLNTKGYREQVFEKPWEHWIASGEQVAGAVAKLPGVQQVFPRVGFYGLLSTDRVTVSGQGQGVDGAAEAQFFDTINVEQGQNLTTEPDGILLGLGLARALGVKPGDRVTVLTNTVHGSMNGLDFVVTGIFHLGAKEVDDSLFKIQLKAAQRLLDTDRVESIALGLATEDAWDAVARSTIAQLPELEATPFAALDEVYYQHAVDWLNQQFAVIQLIILVIVTLGIVNTVSFTILERQAELGNLRANGDSRLEILLLLGWEGLGLGIIGGILGLSLAAIFTATALRHGIPMPPAPGITRQYHILLELQPRAALRDFALGTTAALLGTLVTATRVALRPIGQALRSF